MTSSMDTVDNLALVIMSNLVVAEHALANYTEA